jgi:thiol-disulfide isomerase/thioredoxin
MTSINTVVTTDRYKSGFSYTEYLSQINVNKERFDEFYQNFTIPAEVIEIFENAQKTNGPLKILVIGEDWCPDVYRGMPVIAKIASECNIEIKIFPRDENLDLSDLFLKDGEFRSIPVCVIFTNELEYIGHWIERSSKANDERKIIEDQIKKEMPDAEEQNIRSELRDRTRDKYPEWQLETAKELAVLLE